jgi:hypothetical protein
MFFCARLSAHGLLRFLRTDSRARLSAQSCQRTADGTRLPAHDLRRTATASGARTASRAWLPAGAWLPGARPPAPGFPRTACRAWLPAGARLPAHGFRPAHGFPRMASGRRTASRAWLPAGAWLPVHRLPAHARPNKRQNSVDLDTAKRLAKLSFGSLAWQCSGPPAQVQHPGRRRPGPGPRFLARGSIKILNPSCAEQTSPNQNGDQLCLSSTPVGHESILSTYHRNARSAASAPDPPFCLRAIRKWTIRQMFTQRSAPL